METNEIYKDIIGHKVLVRSVEAGVYFGTLEAVDGKAVRLTDARNIWHWTGANCLADIAENGVTGDKISRTVSSIVLTGACQVLPLSDAAIDNLYKQPVWTR
ncbi:MAG: hypothetical protein IKI72_03890 [Bacteroidales bacterium]|nr:hypothetical protein [Bacteroidales bacterium]